MFDEKSYGVKMDKAIDVFSKELSSLRTGRANAAMLDLIKVDVYGQQMPINQIGSITTPEPRMINIQVWDSNNVSLVDAAIKKSEKEISEFLLVTELFWNKLNSAINNSPITIHKIMFLLKFFINTY